LQPLLASGTLKRDAEAIIKLGKGENVDEFVLGFPLEEDGTVGKMARVVQKLADALTELGATVHLVDERYTSVQAEADLRSMDFKGSQIRRNKDGLSAVLVLERYLNE
jgi:putative Holliday junction resolvase